VLKNINVNHLPPSRHRSQPRSTASWAKVSSGLASHVVERRVSDQVASGPVFFITSSSVGFPKLQAKKIENIQKIINGNDKSKPK